MATLSLSPRAIYEEVAERLRQRIFSRELEPGSWIDELKIAQDYGISRTPLRKVMKLNRHNSLLKSGRIEESLHEHRALMAAIAGHEATVAVQRMQEHFKNGLE